MSETEIEYGAVLRSVERFLRRFTDPYTRQNREDLAQEAVIETWRRGATLRDRGRAVAFARTVARRLRFRALLRAARRAQHQAAVTELPNPDLAELPPPGADPRAFRVGDRWVEFDWLVEHLDEVLDGLGPINEPIVRGFYRGATCRELGARYGLPAAGIKARIHRSRQRIRQSFVERARCAPRKGFAGRSRGPSSDDRGERP
jgi:RNA polymerase sigma factor (sigma-70 family)